MAFTQQRLPGIWACGKCKVTSTHPLYPQTPSYGYIEVAGTAYFLNPSSATACLNQTAFTPQGTLAYHPCGEAKTAQHAVVANPCDCTVLGRRGVPWFCVVHRGGWLCPKCSAADVDLQRTLRPGDRILADWKNYIANNAAYGSVRSWMPSLPDATFQDRQAFRNNFAEPNGHICKNKKYGSGPKGLGVPCGFIYGQFVTFAKDPEQYDCHLGSVTVPVTESRQQQGAASLAHRPKPAYTENKW